LTVLSASDTRAAWQTPLQWPDASTTSSDAQSLITERLLKAAIVFALLALTVLDRFGLRVTGDTSIPIGMIAMYALAGAMVLAGAAELNARAALAYLAVASAAALSFMVNLAFAPPAYVSIMSLLLLIVLYAPFCVSLRRGAVAPQLWRWTMSVYIGFAVFVGVAGIAQYFAQFLFNAPWLFDYTPLLPEAIQTSSDWNTVHSTGEWTKSNGFFMREPSFFSILMALGLICELSLARRKWVIAVLATGLALSYSGSGLLCLGVALLFPLGRGTLARILAFTVLAAATVLLLGDALHLSYTLNRVNEFASSASSAYCRFIYPTVSALQQIDSSPWTSLLGHGPGSIVRMGGTCPDGFDMAFAKALFEYGLLGTLAFGILILGALSRSAAPERSRAGGAGDRVLLTGLLAADTLLVIYIISAMWPEGGAGGVLSQASPTTRRAVPV
jgi:hypothetical protein